LHHDVAAQHPDAVARLAEGFVHWPLEPPRQRVARTPRWKLVELPRLDGGYEPRLYDLAADPAESVDVKHQQRKVYRRLQDALDQWSADLPQGTARSDDAAVVESLQALGYLGGGKSRGR
jgi:hypothetical protein